MSTAPMYFCSDEDIANVATTDFAVLSPADQSLARGRDGAIESNVPWVLSSASTDFLASSVGPGNVVQISGPKPPFRPPVECFGVVSADSGSVTLKRRGMPAATGTTPTQGADVSAAVFSVVTFAPQILRASMDLERRFGVSDFIYGRRTSDLFDPTELRDATVFSVLSAVYLDASRGTGDRTTGQPDVWAIKSLRYADLLSDLLSRVEIHWSAGLVVGGGPVAAPSRLCGRLSR